MIPAVKHVETPRFSTCWSTLKPWEVSIWCISEHQDDEKWFKWTKMNSTVVNANTQHWLWKAAICQCSCHSISQNAIAYITTAPLSLEFTRAAKALLYESNGMWSAIECAVDGVATCPRTARNLKLPGATQISLSLSLTILSPVNIFRLPSWTLWQSPSAVSPDLKYSAYKAHKAYIHGCNSGTGLGPRSQSKRRKSWVMFGLFQIPKFPNFNSLQSSSIHFVLPQFHLAEDFARQSPAYIINTSSFHISVEKLQLELANVMVPSSIGVVTTPRKYKKLWQSPHIFFLKIVSWCFRFCIASALLLL